MAADEGPVPDGPCDFLTYPALGGPTRWQGAYCDGLRDGLWRVTDATTGAPCWETSCRLGRWHGPARGWYPNGQLMYEGARIEDRHDGLWTYWYETGKMAARGRYVDDRKAGAWEYWDEDGQPIGWSEWERRYMADYDFAYNDYTGTPHSESWPHPPGETPRPSVTIEQILRDAGGGAEGSE